MGSKKSSMKGLKSECSNRRAKKKGQAPNGKTQPCRQGNTGGNFVF